MSEGGRRDKGDMNRTLRMNLGRAWPVVVSCVLFACAPSLPATKAPAVTNAPALTNARPPVELPIWPGPVPDAVPLPGVENTRTTGTALIGGHPVTALENVAH